MKRKKEENIQTSAQQDYFDTSKGCMFVCYRFKQIMRLFEKDWIVFKKVVKLSITKEIKLQGHGRKRGICVAYQLTKRVPWYERMTDAITSRTLVISASNSCPPDTSEIEKQFLLRTSMLIARVAVNEILWGAE